MPRVETSRAEIFYTVSEGGENAPTLVLVHGAGGAHLHWPMELRRLPQTTVYALDLPGHGRSSKEEGRNTIEDYARDVVAFLDALGIRRTIIAGHSMGGAIALQMALDDADRVNGLALIATGARLRVHPRILETVRGDFEEGVDLIARSLWSEGTDRGLIERGKKALTEIGQDVLLGDLVATDRFDLMDHLDEIEAPALVLVGSADELTPVKYARFLVERIPHAAPLVIIKEAGHMVALEQPAEVAQTVEIFLKRIFLA